MKKFIFILTGSVLLFATSCEKEEIRPHGNEYENYNSSPRESGENSSGPSHCNPFNNNRGLVMEGDTTGTITDPNRDEDDERKTKMNSRK